MSGSRATWQDIAIIAISGQMHCWRWTTSSCAKNVVVEEAAQKSCPSPRKSNSYNFLRIMIEDIDLAKSESSLQKDLPRKFLVDGMLGSIATKLRILGFDSTYDKESQDHELISEAALEGRVLVTSDQVLWLRAKQRHIRAILIKAATERERLIELCQKAGIDHLDLSVVSRCSACNSMLEEIGQKDDLGRTIFKCTNCSKLFWRGSHWRKLDSLFSSINRSLNSEESLSSK